jgi:large subunit ribosomal protein L4
MAGEARGQIEIDPAVLGGEVRSKLIKQAIVTWLDHQRLEAARQKSRSDVAGSTRKMYRQKGTGNARMGPIRAPQRRGGGRAFAKRGPRSSKDMPRKMGRLARNSALLAKIKAGDVLAVENLACSEPRTSVMAAMLGALKAESGAVVATAGYDRNVLLSGRNIAKTDVRVFDELHAYEIIRRPKLIISKAALEKLASGKA